MNLLNRQYVSLLMRDEDTTGVPVFEETVPPPPPKTKKYGWKPEPRTTDKVAKKPPRIIAKKDSRLVKFVKTNKKIVTVSQDLMRKRAME